jgi:hypothetical protein
VRFSPSMGQSKDDLSSFTLLLATFPVPLGFEQTSVNECIDLVKKLGELKPKHRPRFFKDEEELITQHSEAVLKIVLHRIGDNTISAHGSSALLSSAKLCDACMQMAPTLIFFPESLVVINKCLSTLGAEGIKSDIVKRLRDVAERMEDKEQAKLLANQVAASVGVDLQTFFRRRR